MPGIGGMSPEFRPQETQNIDRIGKENGTLEAHEERQPEPVSIFNALDTDQNSSVNLAEAKSKVMQGMQAGSNNGVLNVSNGSFSFKSLFETAMQKFNNISYEATEQGAAGVDAQIDSQVTSFNQSAEQLYNQYLEQRTNEAKSTSQIEDGKLVYRDAAGQIFETLDLSTAELAKYGYDENGNLLSADHMNTNGETVYETDYTYNDKNQLTSQTVTTNGNTATTSYQYNDAGQVTKESTVDTNGGTYEVNTNYDKKGRRTSEEISMSFGGTRTTLTTNYDKKGRIRETENTTTDATGTSTKTETYRKDGSRSTVRENASITDANTGTTTTTSFSTDYRRNGTVDEKSETRTETNTDGSSISSTISTDYRRNGSVDDETKTVVLPDGSSTTSETEYYRNGNTKNFSSTSSNGFEGEISYRRDGSMKRMELENPNGSTSDTRYRNDGSVERHEITNADGTTVDTRHNEDGSTVAYKYNAQGELKTTTTTTALPDGGKQVVTETPEGATITDIYDKDGNQVSQKMVSTTGYVTTKTFGGEEEAPVTPQGENLLTPFQGAEAPVTDQAPVNYTGAETSIVLTQPSYLNGLMADNSEDASLSMLTPFEGAKPPVTDQAPVNYTGAETSVVLTQPSYLNGLMADNNEDASLSMLTPFEGAKPPVTDHEPIQHTGNDAPVTPTSVETDTPTKENEAPTTPTTPTTPTEPTTPTTPVAESTTPIAPAEPQEKALTKEEINEIISNLKPGESFTDTNTFSLGSLLRSTETITWTRNDDGTLSTLEAGQVGSNSATFETRYSDDMKTTIFKDIETNTGKSLNAKTRVHYENGEPSKNVTSLSNYKNKRSAFSLEYTLIATIKRTQFTSQEVKDDQGNVILKYENGEFTNAKGKVVDESKALKILERANESGLLRELVQNR